MSQYANAITLGSVTLILDKISVSKVPGTKKQVVGKRLHMKEIPGSIVQDWRLTITGRLPTTSRHTNRGTLEGYDDLKVHTLVDGIHDGNYFIVPGSLVWDDGNNISTNYKFRFTLIQDQ